MSTDLSAPHYVILYIYIYIYIYMCVCVCVCVCVCKINFYLQLIALKMAMKDVRNI